MAPSVASTEKIPDFNLSAYVAMLQRGGSGAAVGVAGVLCRVRRPLVAVCRHGAARAEMQRKHVVIISHYARAGQAPAGGQLHAEGQTQGVGCVAVAECRASHLRPVFADMLFHYVAVSPCEAVFVVVLPAIGGMAAVADAYGARTFVSEGAFCRAAVHGEGLADESLPGIVVGPPFMHLAVGGIDGSFRRECSAVAALQPLGAPVGQQAADTLQQRVLPLECVL